MAYTSTQLTTFYKALAGAAPDAATAAAISTAAQQNATGQIKGYQALDVPLDSLGVQATFDVIEGSYQVFTGAATSAAGLNYLRGDPGAGNPNGLNSAYYANFNLENRYYNFAINLAAAGGAGNAAFVSRYGGLSLAQTVDAAYEAIIGVASVGADAAAAAKADILSRSDYFAQVARERAGGVDAGGAAGQNLALKAILIGYILEEGVRADIGTYARALDEFEGAAAGNGAIYGSNILTTYAPGGAGYGTGPGGARTGGGVNFFLGAGVDNFDHPGAHSTFVAQLVGAGGAGTSTLQPADVVHAGGGDNTLFLTTSAAGPGAVNADIGATLTGLQAVNLRALGGAPASLSASSVPGATTFTAYHSPGAVYFAGLGDGVTAGLVGDGVTVGSSLQAGYVGTATATLAVSAGVIDGAVYLGGSGLALVLVDSTGAPNTLRTLTTEAGLQELDVAADAPLTLQFLQGASAPRTIKVSGAAPVDLGTVLGATPAANTTLTQLISTNTAGVSAHLQAAQNAGAQAAMTLTTAAGATDSLVIDGAVSGASNIHLGGGGAGGPDSLSFTGSIGAGALIDGGGDGVLGVTAAQLLQFSNFSAGQRGRITGFATLSALTPLAAGQTYDLTTLGAGALHTVGVAGGGSATLVAPSSAAVAFAASLATYGGQLNVSEVGAAAGASDTLSLTFDAQRDTAVARIAAPNVEGLTVVASKAPGAATPQLTLSFTDAALKSLAISGDEAVSFSASVGGANGPSAAFTQLTAVVSTSIAAVTLDLSALGSAANPLTVVTGAGADTVTVREAASVVAGGGGDTLVVQPASTAERYSSLLDAAAGDRVQFTGANASYADGVLTKLTLGAGASLRDYLDAATSAAHPVGDVAAFDFGGDTYLVANASLEATFQDGADAVVRLAGVHAVASVQAGVILLGS